MRFFHIAVLAITALLSPVSAGLIASSSREWNDFKMKFNKVYETAAEEELRFQIFKDNMARSAQLQLKDPLATFGATRFSDLSPAEFKKQYLGYRRDAAVAAARANSFAVKECEKDVAPQSVDWRTSGAVTPVKDQGQCGSCWAFSAVEGVESAWFLKHNTSVVLSPQQVVSCDKGDTGCNGGDLPPAFEYIQKNGLETEASYPYTGEDDTCTFNAAKVVAHITGFTYATKPCSEKTPACNNQDEATLLTNLATTGPVSICVDADNSWQTYSGGILKAGCKHGWDDLNHCVQLVGYSTSGGTPYWIVRNSWGASWGEKGYIYLAYGSNVCGVADEATFATSA